MKNKENLSSLIKYIQLLKALKKATSIKGGVFYCYKYFFHKYYPFEELKFYDWYPLIFCFGVKDPKKSFKKNKRYFFGLNFHHLPVKARIYWMSKFKRIFSSHFEKGGYKIIPAITYEILLKIMKKAKIGVRKYRYEAVKDLRQVSLDELDYIMKWYAKTYYAVTIKEIQERYRNFKP